MKINFEAFKFEPVIELPADYEVYDFTQGYDAQRELKCDFGIGRYNEVRKDMYTQSMYSGSGRNIHMGIDIAAPATTPVKSFYQGEVDSFADHNIQGNYGPTIVIKYEFNDAILYALYGHLSRRSLQGKSVGQKVSAGETIGYVGEPFENGGWNSHLHFQLSKVPPENADLPGVVSREELAWALDTFPDPQWVLGKLYD